MNDYEKIKKIILYLDQHFKEQPSLAELAKLVGLSEFHFHRLFTRWAGITPKNFLQCITAEHAKKCLRESKSILETSLAAGLSGPSRLHDLLISVEGSTPGEFKTKGQGLEIFYGFYPSPFGKVLIGKSQRGICYLSFVDKGERTALQELKKYWTNAKIVHKPSIMQKLGKELFTFRSRDSRKKNTVKIHLNGTAFQVKVWSALLQISSGELYSYGDIAEAVGMPGAARAVGTAIGNNKIAFLIPCHRVIRESGALGGYRWGLTRKKVILGWETSEAEDK